MLLCTTQIVHRLRKLVHKIDQGSCLGAPPFVEDQYILQSECFHALPSPTLL